MTLESIQGGQESRSVTSLADAIFAPVNKAYKLGGFGLAFLGLGILLMLLVFLSGRGGIPAYLVFMTGLLLVVATGVLFFYKDVAPLFRVQSNIQRNKQLIDTVQATAIQLTDIVYQGQALAFKHAEAVASVLQMTLPLVRNLPGIGQVANSQSVVRAETLATKIVETAKAARQVIVDVRDALIDSDPEPLRQYLDDLRGLSSQLEKVLAEAHAQPTPANPSPAADG
jgi:hypothetical protein